MTTRYRITHRTTYDYALPVNLARHRLHLKPRSCPWQESESARLHVAPLPDRITERLDGFGNPTVLVEFLKAHGDLAVESRLDVAVSARPWAARIEAEAIPGWEEVRDLLAYGGHGHSAEEIAALQMRFESPSVRVKREFEAYAAPSFAGPGSVLDATRDLMHRIHTEFIYDPEATDVGTPVLSVLSNRRGVCQDFAHVMIACLRSVGLPARYVSGYLRTAPPAGQSRLVGADATHAWVSTWIPGLGWVEFDPTNDCLADERHIVLAWGRDFSDVSPIRGVIHGGAEQRLEVAVTVQTDDEFAASERSGDPPGREAG